MYKKGSHNHSSIIIHASDFLKHLKSLNYSEKSIKAYRIALDKFQVFLSKKRISRIQDVTLTTLDKYRLFLVDAGFTGASVSLYLRSVRLLFSFLEDTDVIFINPAEHLIIPKIKRDIGHVPTESDVEKLLEQPDISIPDGIRDRAFMEILYSSGVRLEELVGLNTADVDLRNKTARVTGKGDRERAVPLGKHAVFWTEKYIGEVRPKLLRNDTEPALFLGSKHGKRINYLIVERLLRSYSEEAEIEPITPHSLRRACATHMLKNGAHPVHIQKLLGHSSLKVLRQYLKVSVTDLKKMHSERNPGK